MVRVSISQENLLARKLGVDDVQFREILYVNQFTVNYVYAVYKKKKEVGTVSLTWSTRRIEHLVTLRRFSDNMLMSTKVFDNDKVFSFFKESA